jgi:uncharacterized protein (DUF983 family)
MTTKYCKECDETKLLDKFPKGRNKCQECRNKGSKKSYDKNHKKKPICSDPTKNICSSCKQTKPKDEFIKERNLCKDCKKVLSDKNYKKDAEIHLENVHKLKECADCGEEKEIEKFAISKNSCRKCKLKYGVKYHRERRKNDPAFKIRCNLSSRIYQAVKSQNTKKHHATMILTDCTKEFLKDWFEHQFDSKMSWENHGKYWHIDHVIPCASYDLLIEEEQYKCCNWKNLRPCEGKANISKGSKIDNWQILLQNIRVYYYEKRTQGSKSNTPSVCD